MGGEMESVTGLDYLTEMVLAAGALGIAAFGIVDGLKWTFAGTFGFSTILKMVQPAADALALAFGPEWKDILKEQYRNGRAKGTARATIRQGIRIGLTGDNARDVCRIAPVVAPDDLAAVVDKMRHGDDLSDVDQGILGRFELGLDARLDGAFGKAEAQYVGYARALAGVIAVAASLVAAGYLAEQSSVSHIWLRAVIVGFVAVPLAPISKDVANALTAAGRALGRR